MNVGTLLFLQHEEVLILRKLILLLLFSQTAKCIQVSNYESKYPVSPQTYIAYVVSCPTSTLKDCIQNSATAITQYIFAFTQPLHSTKDLNEGN